MTKKFVFLFTIMALVFSANYSAFALAEKQPANLSTPGIEKTLILPEVAIEGSGVIALGTAIDPQSGKLVEGYAIVHHKKDKAKSNNAQGQGKTTTASACYGYLGKGAKWKIVEPWVFSGANSEGLDEAVLFALTQEGVNKWEDAADGVAGNSVGGNILGEGSLTSNTLEADTASPDGQNEVYFGNVSDSSAIAVTIVWGRFGGPINQRQLVEWDMIFDESDFDWATTGEAGKMDFDSIATHELGHAVGMADLYTSSCAEETMFGYSTEGELKKRDLNTGDIIGVNTLY
ncbi:hypothetical protein C4572_01855 [Candidatus Parcubacteria bacterium]|nr:MAG: hypothetical protein C4572_01855 [Candidatus Parcubacteria bacterium]